MECPWHITDTTPPFLFLIPFWSYLLLYYCCHQTVTTTDNCYEYKQTLKSIITTRARRAHNVHWCFYAVSLYYKVREMPRKHRELCIIQIPTVRSMISLCGFEKPYVRVDALESTIGFDRQLCHPSSQEKYTVYFLLPAFYFILYCKIYYKIIMCNNINNNSRL